MIWIVLLVAGLFEVAWAISLKYANGFSNIVPSVITIVCMVLSVVLLALALKRLPLGTAYAIWTGIGVLGTTLLGIYLFKESVSLSRLIFIAFIAIGIIGLKWVESV